MELKITGENGIADFFERISGKRIDGADISFNIKQQNKECDKVFKRAEEIESDRFECRQLGINYVNPGIACFVAGYLAL